MELIQSVMELVESVAELIKSGLQLVNSIAQLVNSVTKLSDFAGELIVCAVAAGTCGLKMAAVLMVGSGGGHLAVGSHFSTYALAIFCTYRLDRLCRSPKLYQ